MVKLLSLTSSALYTTALLSSASAGGLRRELHSGDGDVDQEVNNNGLGTLNFYEDNGSGGASGCSELASLASKVDTLVAASSSPSSSSCRTAELPRASANPPASLTVTELRQTDFAKGTYRATEPGIYRLMEDVSFLPDLNANGEHWPSCETAAKAAAYCENGRPKGAYHLGFFAALTLEGNDVHLDLNGHTLEQSKLHSLKQRFFAVVETGSAPFIEGQGPGDFGPQTIGCTHCSVYGGTLGLSAHHGIHGVRNEDITIKDVVFKDYEVASISLNGPQRLLIENVDAQGHLTEIPARATLSAARFQQLFVNSFPPGTPLPAGLTAASAHLQTLEDQFVDSVINSTPLADTHEAQRLFGNFDTADGQLVDGNAYGIVIHGRGVLVNGFVQEQTSNFAEDAQDVTIRNSKISNVLARVNEVVGVKQPAGSHGEFKPMVDSAGSLIRVDEQNDGLLGAGGTFEVDALHQLRFEYQSFLDTLDPATQAQARGTMRIDSALAQAWVTGGDTAVETQLSTYTSVCNADSMVHSNKGVIGLFVQKAKGLTLSDVHINNVKNYGPLGSLACGNYIESQWAGHRGYTGSQTYGIVVAGSRDITLSDIDVSNVWSANADSYGAAFFNDVDDVCTQDLDITGITTSAGADRGPNDPPAALKLLLGRDVSGFSSVSTSTD